LFGNEIPVAKEYLKALIVPPPLVFNWYNEARKFTPILESSICGTRSKANFKKIRKYDLIFTSYAVAARDLPF
jgi:non-specific serine/threonine protein kinase